MGVNPTLKDRQRHILFRVVGQAKVGEEEARRAAYGAILRFLGELGFSEASPKLMLFDEARQEGVLKVERSQAERVKAALALATEAGGKPAALRVLKVSGTIKRLKG